MLLFKKTISSSIFSSLYLFIFVSLISLIWTIDFYSSALNNLVILIIIIYFILYALIFTLIFFLNKCWTYKFYAKEIIITFKLWFIKRTNIIYLDKRNDMVKINSNFILKIFNETKLKVIGSNGYHVFSLTMKQDLKDELISFLIPVNILEKKPYVKNRDYVYNRRNIFSILLLNTLVLIGFILLEIVIFAVSSKIIYQFSNRLIVALLILTITFFILYSIFEIFHTENTKIRIIGEYIFLSRGRLFKNESIIPLSNIKNKYFFITTFPRFLNSYRASYKINNTATTRFPLSYSICDLLTDDLTNIRTEQKFKWNLYLLAEIPLLLFSIALGFASITISIILFVLSSLCLFQAYFKNSFNVFDNKIVIKKYLVLKKTFYIAPKEVERVRMFRLPFKYIYARLKLSKGSVYIILNKEETDSMKSVLGYYRKNNN